MLASTLALLASSTLRAEDDDSKPTPAEIGFAKGFVRAFSPEAGRLLDQLTQAASAKDRLQIQASIQALQALGLDRKTTSVLWQGALLSDSFASIEEQIGDGTGQLVGGLIKLLLDSPSEAKINFVKTEHNLIRGQQKGMVIHVDFNIENHMSSPCQMAAYFSFADGAMLKDFDKNYTTDNGQVSTSAFFTPLYKNAHFEDIEMFIPYEQLHMASGEHSLKFTLRIFSLDQKQFVGPEWKGGNFTLKEP